MFDVCGQCLKNGGLKIIIATIFQLVIIGFLKFIKNEKVFILDEGTTIKQLVISGSC